MRCKFRTFLALLWTVVVAVPAMAQQLDPDIIQVRILPVAEVYRDTFTLGEISELDGFDIVALKALAEIKMGRSPLPGRSLRINSPLVRSRIARSVSLANLDLIVPRGAVVTRAAIVVPAEEIEAMVLDHAARDVGVAEDDLQQELAGVISDAVLPRGEIVWDIRPLGKNITDSGSRSYRVVARVDGKVVWRTIVRLNQKVYRDVVVAKSAIRRNATISEGDLEMVRRSYSDRSRAQYFSNVADVVGKQARRAIAAGEPIHPEALSVPFAVHEGGRVRLLFETPRLIVEVQGVALINGHIGDFIPAKNLQSGKVVYGILDGNHTLRVN